MTDNKISDLDPALQPIALKCLSDWTTQYSDRKSVKIIVTWRSNVDQQVAYNAGLSKCKAGEGKHNVCDVEGNPASRAFDYACFTDTGDYIADGTHPYYADFGKIGENNGLVWGGSWKSWQDWDHLEMVG